MADNNQAQDVKDILDGWGLHRKKIDLNSDHAKQVRETYKEAFEVVKTDWGLEMLLRFFDLPEEQQETFLKMLESLQGKTSEDFANEFHSTAQYRAFKKVFPNIEFNDYTEQAAYIDGLSDTLINIYFPDLASQARPGATFAEAAGIPAESIKPGSFEAFQEALWNELYPPTAADPAEPGAALDRVTVKRAGAVEYPLDKVNLNIWQFLEETSGQLRFAMEAKRGPQNTRKQIDCIYSIDFSALEEEGIKTTRRLTSFDKRVYIAASALYNAGNDVITLRQIFYAMGQKGSNPTVAQLERINESITKMARAWVTVDDSQEHNAYNYNLDEGDIKNGWRRGKYEGSLLPLERVSIKANGKTTDAALHLFREPPVITFAKMRNQITTVDLKLLQSPASKTDMNLAIEDYLISRLSRAKKSGKESEKILFKTLFEKTGITEKKQRARTPDKIKTYLDYYKEAGDMLKSYLLEKESVTVYF